MQRQKKEKDRSILLQKDNESQSKKQSHPNKIYQNCTLGDICWGGREEKEALLVELVGNQSPSLKHLP